MDCHRLSPGLGKSPGGGNGNLLQYSCLENSIDRGAWGCKESGMTERLNTDALHIELFNHFSSRTEPRSSRITQERLEAGNSGKT